MSLEGVWICCANLKLQSWVKCQKRIFTRALTTHIPPSNCLLNNILHSEDEQSLCSLIESVHPMCRSVPNNYYVRHKFAPSIITSSQEYRKLLLVLSRNRELRICHLEQARWEAVCWRTTVEWRWQDLSPSLSVDGWTLLRTKPHELVWLWKLQILQPCAQHRSELSAAVA